MNERVLVIGATGTVGSLVAANLVAAGTAVRGATRRPEAAAPGLPEGVELVAFDLEHPQTFAPALEGVQRVFLMARPGDERPQAVAAPLIQEMAESGVEHVVNLTALGVETRQDIGLRQVELLLEESGIGFTHLRPNWFMQIFSAGPLHASIRATGEIRLPAGDATISFIDVRDLAAVAAAALREPAAHAGRAYTLTGPESLDHHAVAAAISEAAGRTVRYRSISEDEMRQAVVAAGLGPALAERQVGFYRLVRAGFCSPISDAVETVLHRPPIRFARFALDHAACWR